MKWVYRLLKHFLDVAEQIGAFRTYPLGTITDANDAFSGIFPFNMSSTIANAGGNIGLLIHYSGPDERYATQLCTIFASPSTTKIRHKYNGSWSDWSTIQ